MARRIKAVHATTPSRRLAPTELRAHLAARLRARRGEIEQAIFTRVSSVSDPTEVRDPTYVEGLRQAVSAAVDHGIAAACGNSWTVAPVPAELLTQARHAAGSGVSLDTVLRRYVAGHSLLADFVMQEAQAQKGADSADLQRLSRAQAAFLDRIVAEVSVEHRRETERRSRSAGARRSELVRGLLAGELLDPSELGYELDGWHIAVVAAAEGGGEEALRAMSADLDYRLLLLRHGRVAWAWLGSSKRAPPDRVPPAVATSLPARAVVAFGEQAHGLDGWRFTHRQAIAALPIAFRRPGRVTRYGEVALLASMLQDEVLLRSLRERFLAPMEVERGTGVSMRRTLVAYFTAERNVTSAAAALNVNRHTVTNRLRAIEDLIGRPLGECAVEFEALMRLDELGLLEGSRLANMDGGAEPDPPPC